MAASGYNPSDDIGKPVKKEADKQAGGAIPIQGGPPPTPAKPVVAPANNPAIVPAEVPIPKADGAQEYVAGGFRSTVYPNTYHALSQRIDDATIEFGPNLYEVMLRDSTVGGAFDLFKLGTLEGEITVLPAVVKTDKPLSEQKDDPKVQKAETIADFCARALRRLPRPAEDMLFEYLDGAAYAQKLGEMVLEIAATGADRGKITLKRIDMKPAWSWAWVIDPYSAVLGILGAVPGQAGLPLGIVGAEGQVSGSAVFLPREKFCIFTWMAKDGDPRGHSQLRRAVNGWNQKVRSMQQYGQYNDRFSQPSLVGTVGPNAQPQVPLDKDGNPIPGGGTVPATTFMYQQLINFAGGMVMVVPHGASVQVIAPPGNGETFQKAIELWKKEIVFAILGTTRGVMEAEHGSKADAEVGQDVQAKPAKWARGVLARMIQRDIFKLLITLNWGPDDAEEFMPIVRVGGVEAHDFAADATAVAALMSAGYFQPSQMKAVDARLNLPVREEEPEDVVTDLEDPIIGEEARQGEADGDDGGAGAGTPPGGAESGSDSSGDGSPPPAGKPASKPGRPPAKGKTKAAPAKGGKTAA